ncbi:amidase family protein [Metabacillus sp. HB246100]
MSNSMNTFNNPKRLFLSVSMIILLLIGSVILPTSLVSATNLKSDNGASWRIHDTVRPSLDTGSFRTVSESPIHGFGNIFVRVSSTPEPLFNDQMMRGFGLTYDGIDTFETTQAVDLGGVHITREIKMDRSESWTRFFDSFTNTTDETVTVEVSFGGALGYGTGDEHGAIQTTSDGDKVITPADEWTIAATPKDDERPVGVVIGTPAPFEGALTKVGNQERNPFETPYVTEGHESNFYGYIHTLTIEPGESESLARFLLVGDTQGLTAIPSTEEKLDNLATEPDFTGLTTEEIYSLENWDITTLPEYNPDTFSESITLDYPEPPTKEEFYTTSNYDVVNKTIAELQTDMEAGVTTSEEITRAYLDRIAAYDNGQFGFNAFITVAENAIEQAKAADEARSNGQTGSLLGIPIAIKDIFDTKDMPNTGGSLALKDWQPATDAHQVNLLREAGAVIIGKTNLSEFAFSGSQSDSGFGQVWNALYPSKTSYGSSGGSSVSVALSMTAAALGSQTGVSLYAPANGASITMFRGTDGMASVHGVMPLNWGQDYAGPMARTVTDLAYLLNATTGTDAKDMLTEEADEHRPADWTVSLDKSALQGKRIGYIPSSFVSGFANDGTGQAVMDHFTDLEAAGATMVEMPDPPSRPDSVKGDKTEEGWARYIELHSSFPFAKGSDILKDENVLPYNHEDEDATRMTSEEVDAWLNYRTEYKERIKQWMDDNNVDAIVYAGFLSDMYNNDSSIYQLSADRGTGVLTSNVGLPTVLVPVGTNPHGYSISMQLVGRAWDDANILGMGYALEQQANGQQFTSFAPALEVMATDNPDPEDPDTDNPDTEDPDTDNPDTDNPDPDNPGTDTPEANTELTLGEQMVVVANQTYTIAGTKAKITMPADLPEGSKVTIIKEDATDHDGLEVAGEVLNVTFEFPEGSTPPTNGYTLTLGYNQGADTEQLAIYYFNETSNEWEHKGGEVNEEEETITLDVPHFSSYGVFVEIEETTPTEDESGTTDDETDSNNDQSTNENEQDENTNETNNTTNNDKSNHNLPNTATSVFNWLMIGAITIATGIVLLIVRRRKVNM